MNQPQQNPQTAQKPYQAKLLHRLVYAVGGLVARAMLKDYNFTTDKVPEMDEPFIIMSNHTTEVDMAMLRMACPKFMYFVCGEHLLRSKNAGLIRTVADPIPEPRGGAAVKTVRQIIDRIRSGYSIMIFPEGCRSFNGETIPVTLSTGKMVKLAGCGLVTYRTTGGYFVAPRWGHKFRKGRMTGQVTGVYTSDQLKSMSAREITDLINEGIYEHAYERQKTEPEAYTCDALAEGLENYLIICPECKSYDSMETVGDKFTCSCCGRGGVYDPYGKLVGEGLVYDNVYDWGKWIEEYFDRDMEGRPADELLFTETDVKLYEIDDLAHEQRDLYSGELRVYADRMEIDGRVFDFGRVSSFSLLYFGKSILFTHTDGYFGITGEHFHAWKCARLLERYKNGN